MANRWWVLQGPGGPPQGVIAVTEGHDRPLRYVPGAGLVDSPLLARPQAACALPRRRLADGRAAGMGDGQDGSLGRGGLARRRGALAAPWFQARRRTAELHGAAWARRAGNS